MCMIALSFNKSWALVRIFWKLHHCVYDVIESGKQNTLCVSVHFCTQDLNAKRLLYVALCLLLIAHCSLLQWKCFMLDEALRKFVPKWRHLKVHSKCLGPQATTSKQASEQNSNFSQQQCKRKSIFSPFCSITCGFCFSNLAIEDSIITEPLMICYCCYSDWDYFAILRFFGLKLANLSKIGTNICCLREIPAKLRLFSHEFQFNDATTDGSIEQAIVAIYTRQWNRK